MPASQDISKLSLVDQQRILKTREIGRRAYAKSASNPEWRAKQSAKQADRQRAFPLSESQKLARECRRQERFQADPALGKRATAAGKNWRKNNPEKSRLIARNCNYRRREAIAEYSKRPQVALAKALRTRLRDALDRGQKSAATLVLLGCTVEELRLHLEAQFLPGMTWENRGSYGWHIDHILPCNSFDLTDPRQQRACFHFTNLQPLWWRDNLAKGSKMPARAQAFASNEN